ncbi:MAG: nuclease-related domain-containing protein [Acidimicrobiales bacterium]
MNELTIARCRRSGHDCLDVCTHTGVRVGWVDLDDGRAVLRRADLRKEFEQALGRYGCELPGQRRDRAGRGRASSPVLAHPRSRPGADVVVGPWVDLALNEPGRSVAATAAALRHEAPVRSLLARLLGVHTRERAFRVGADGERVVGGQLARLPAGWHVLHSVPVGTRGADIDHVVIGPGGIYTVNTKHLPDARVWLRGDLLVVNGHERHYVPAARAEAERASRLLGRALGGAGGGGVDVVGIVALVGAENGFNVRCQPADGAVVVVGHRQLVPWLLRRPTVLRPADVEAAFAAARRPGTWT